MKTISGLLLVGLLLTSQFLPVWASSNDSPYCTNVKAPAFSRIERPLSSMPQVISTDATDEVDIAVQVGTTYDDWAGPGNFGRKIQRDSLGGLHTCWTNARQPFNRDRVISYNFEIPLSGIWFNNGGIPVFAGTGHSGGCLNTTHSGFAVVAANVVREGVLQSIIGIDIDYQVAAFMEYVIPHCTNPVADSILSPISAISCNNTLHTFAQDETTNNVSRIFYSRAFLIDGYQYSPSSYLYPSLRTLAGGGAVATSHTNGSQRVAFVWPNTNIRSGYDNLRGWNGFLASQLNNNLFLCTSNDGGSTWNWEAPINITRFRGWSESQFEETGDTLLAAGDTDRVGFDCAAIFDFSNTLHVVFTTVKMVEDGTIDTTNHTSPPVRRFTSQGCYLWHWSEAYPDSFDLVASAMWTAGKQLSWQTNISRPSLAVAPDNSLVCVWTQYNSRDTSSNGYPCGEIYASKSTNAGHNWYGATNLTNTPANRGTCGNVHSESWASCQEKLLNSTSDSLYIQYIDDLNGGTSVRDSSDWTLNPVCVLPVSINQIQTTTTISRRPLWVGRIDRTQLYYLALTSPEQGDTLIIGQNDTIYWDSNIGTSMNLYINYNYPSGEWVQVCSNVPGIGMCSYALFGSESDHARFKIASSSNPLFADTSNFDLIVRRSSATITLLNPNGGERLFTGSIDTIHWTTNLTSGTVNLQLMQGYPNGTWDTTSTTSSDRWLLPMACFGSYQCFQSS